MTNEDMERSLELVPERMRDGLRRYIVNGVPPGHFLTAVICNDLRGACERADDENRRLMFDYVRALYNGAPAQSWGSKAAFEAWCLVGGQLGVEAKVAAS